jgi:hypothetical protein
LMPAPLPPLAAVAPVPVEEPVPPPKPPGPAEPPESVDEQALHSRKGDKPITTKPRRIVMISEE